MHHLLAITLPPLIADYRGWWIAGAIVVLGLFAFGFKDTKRFSITRVWAISGVSFDESIRRRVLWIIPLAILGVIVVSQLQRPIDEQDAIRQTTKFSLFATGMLVTITTIILACTNLPREIENRVIYTIVTKPTTRLEIVAGKVVGFARVSLAILLIMGAFTYAYLGLRAGALNRDIGVRLQANAVPATLVPTLKHYQTHGLLSAKTFQQADNVEIFARLPEVGEEKKWFSGGNEGGFLVPFDLPPELLDPAGSPETSPAQHGLMVQINVGYAPRAKAPPAKPAIAPSTNPNEPLPYWGPFIKPPEERRRPASSVKPPTPQIGVALLNQNREHIASLAEMFGKPAFELTDKDSVNALAAKILPANVGDLLRKPQRIFIHVTGSTSDIDYYITSRAPVAIIGPGDADHPPTIFKPAGDPIFLTRTGTFGHQLRGGDPAQSPVAIYPFRAAPVSGDKPVPFELRLGIERAGMDEVPDVDRPTVLEVRVRNRQTKKLSEPFTLMPESNRTVFFDVPTADMAGGDFDVIVRTVTPGHFVGLLPTSLQMVIEEQSFSLNLGKSLLILWLMAILVTTVAIFCSTFLSWPIAIVLTIVILLGHWGVMQLGDATQPGIGNQIVQDLFRDTDASQAKAVSATVEKLSSLLNLVASVLPDIAQFSAVEDIERGVAIPGHKLLEALKITLGFGIPLIVLAYACLRNKEVAP